MSITYEQLVAKLKYDPDTGVFTRVSTGYKAGTINSCGYVRIFFEKKAYLAHRLAVLYMTQKLPTTDVDHINGNRYDNRWKNLRVVDRTTNAQNRTKPNKNNRSGTIGVHEQKGRWVAQIHTKATGKQYLGMYATKDEAIAAYNKAKFGGYLANH